MSYQDLRKLHYKDERQQKEVYLRRFNDPDTVRLDFMIGDRPAFFVPGKEVVDLMYRILRLDKEIAVLCTKLPAQALTQYSRKCLIDEIVLTNNIEGVHSSRKEIGEALAVLENQSEKKGKKTRFLGLVNKYLKLMSDEAVPINSCQDIRDLYNDIVLPEVAYEDRSNIPDGKIFRKDHTAVHSVTGKVIHNGLYPESKIISHMEQALAFLNDESIEPLYRISIFHYLFEYIHPFYDGNGRLGRFIFSYCITQHLTPLLAYRISETIKENIKQYYDAFELCNDRHNLGDLTPFLLMMLEMIYRSAVELKEALQRKHISWERYSAIIPILANSSVVEMSFLYRYLIQVSLFGEQGAPTKFLLELLKVSPSTLRKYLRIVAQQNLLITEKDGNEKFYKIDLKILDDIIFNLI